MEGIANKHERRRRPMHETVLGIVAVPPQHELLEDEEREDAREQRAEGRRRREGLERFRQQAQERGAEQRPYRIADERREEPRPETIADQQERRGRQQSAQAADDAQPERGEHLHRPILAYDATYPFRARTR
jgi:hypothetical protein